MAEKQALVVIKKINMVAAGAHGGSWKVAFADFMTALMAFFLCMWLLGQSEDVKKQVSDHFSTPSVIEYEFNNYGVELTLEKLFLDLINEPLKVLQDFVTPADATPNFLALGSKNIVMAHLAEELGDVAQSLEVNSDEFVIELPESALFKPGSSSTTAAFLPLMKKLQTIAGGLEDALIYVDVVVDLRVFPSNSKSQAEAVADQRLATVTPLIADARTNGSVDIFGRTVIESGANTVKGDGEVTQGKVVIRMKQKPTKEDGSKQRPLQQVFGGSSAKDPYTNFVKKISNRKESSGPQKQ